MSGYYTKGKPYQHRDGYSVTYFRIDTYHCDKYPDLDGEKDRLFAAAIDDTSDHFVIRNGYNPDCSCCWLGFGHTTDSHNKHIKEWKAKV